MKTISTVLTEQELTADVLVRVAQCPVDHPYPEEWELHGRPVHCCDGWVWQLGEFDYDMPNPYEVGDVLYHKERWTWVPWTTDTIMVACGSDGEHRELTPPDNWHNLYLKENLWCSAHSMPYWASRHRRTVTSVELVRLQEMTQAMLDGTIYAKTSAWFDERWDAANPEHPWASNPWVWLVAVERQGD